ncbi:hypothetical protein ACE5SH_06230 [Lactiplantibacillus plantarum]|uniref:hypothetical protein n=1 Tax=Lactiplantibacillus plantarum TaxID=1590 RepID=UPI003C28B2F8
MPVIISWKNVPSLKAKDTRSDALKLGQPKTPACFVTLSHIYPPCLALITAH